MKAKDLKDGKQVKTNDGRKGVIRGVNKNYCFVWFGGHQRNSECFKCDNLKEIPNN